MPGYFDETDRYLNQHGGAPKCRACGNTMFPADDHGRFMCFCGGRGSHLDVVSGLPSPVPVIPQVDVTGMTDAQKAAIPPMNRLDAPPTADEQGLLAVLLENLVDPEG